MISWMQKHRKYLVVTIWVSTIAFVGAGFVGWGSYEYGKKSNSVALVGDTPVGYEAYQTAYSQAYRRYNQMLGGRLDEATARKLGLSKQVMQTLIYQALIKNFAAEYGIVVSDEEVQREILAIPAFQKDGHFDKATYTAVLQGMRMKPKTFEQNLKSDLLVQKTLALLSPDAVKLEKEALGAALFMADTLQYKRFSMDDVTVDIDEAELKRYWEAHKENYLTPKRFTLAIVWIAPSSDPIEESEIEAYYREHRTDFTDEEGKIRPLDEVKADVEKAVRLKKAKKSAQLAYIDMKKGKRTADENKTVDLNDPMFDAKTWAAIEDVMPGSLLKPRVAGDRYAVIKVEGMQMPQPETFEEAKAAVTRDFLVLKKRQKLEEMAKAALKTMEGAETAKEVTRDAVDKLSSLSKPEATAFLQALFTKKSGQGVIVLDDSAIAYNILEQKLLDDKKLTEYDALVAKNVKAIKSKQLQAHLIEQLQQRYPVQIFLKDAE
jgi:peptidyl-prolyl cis-trans isomerase D